MENQKFTTKIAAEGIGHLLFLGAYKNAEQIVKEVEDLRQLNPDKTRFGHVFFEISHFYLHLADRFAFLYLDDKKRGEFVDEVVFQVFRDHLEGHKSVGAVGGKVDDDTFYRIFNDTHKKRQQEYGNYKNPEMGQKRNLYYEFSEKIAKILEAEDDGLVIMSIHGILMPSVGKYHELIKKFISEIPTVE